MRLAIDTAFGSGHNEAGANEDCFEIDTAEEEDCSRGDFSRSVPPSSLVHPSLKLFTIDSSRRLEPRAVPLPFYAPLRA